MGRRTSLESLPPEKFTLAIDCIRAHRHFTMDEIVVSLKELGIDGVSRSALQRYLPKLDKRDALTANPNQGTVITIVERGTGKVLTLASSASGLAIAEMINGLTFPK